MNRKAISRISRRSMLQRAACAAGGLTMLGRSARASHGWHHADFSAEELVREYARIIGATDERQLYLQYSGEIIAIMPGEKQVPLFRLKGLVRQRWRPNDDGTYRHSNFDHGLFCDWDTGKVLTEYRNPLTGQLNQPLHYRSGEAVAVVGLGEDHEKPADSSWQQTGNQVVVSTTKLGREFTNPIDPVRFPQASTGEQIQFSWFSSYMADARDLANRDLPGVETSHTWVFVTNFPAWMKVGTKPGYVLWNWVGKKFLDAPQLDDYIVDEITQRVPGYLTADKPWSESSNGWTQYVREREGAGDVASKE